MAEEVAREGYLVTFGVRPSRPETGYGYIETHSEIKDGVFLVKQFVEKPDYETAKSYVESGRFFWNSGMFAFTAKTFWEALKTYFREIFDHFTGTVEEVLKDFDKVPEDSIDYAVMEKAKNVAMIPLDLSWSDVGSWDAVYELLEKDEGENAVRGKALLSGAKGSLVFSEKRLVALVEVSDLVVAETADAVLVCKRGKTQKVKDVVKKLKEEKGTELVTKVHVTEHRPWGSFTELERGERYKIKRITVMPGQKLSLQMHHHRSEHWIVVKGTAKVTIGEKTLYVHENESVYVPKSTLHRLENPGKIPLEIIEVQVGEYVEEDDIVRFEDAYGRS